LWFESNTEKINAVLFKTVSVGAYVKICRDSSFQAFSTSNSVLNTIKPSIFARKLFRVRDASRSVTNAQWLLFVQNANGDVPMSRAARHQLEIAEAAR
jgi:hypothetical protein